MFWTMIVYILETMKNSLYFTYGYELTDRISNFTVFSYILILRAFFVFEGWLLALLISCSFSALRYIHFAAFLEMYFI